MYPCVAVQFDETTKCLKKEHFKQKQMNVEMKTNDVENGKVNEGFDKWFKQILFACEGLNQYFFWTDDTLRILHVSGKKYNFLKWLLYVFYDYAEKLIMHYK